MAILSSAARDSSPPFVGIREEVPSALFFGWTLHYNEPYRHATRASDFESIPKCAWLLVAAVAPAGENNGTAFTLAAAGKQQAVCQHTSRNQLTNHNGAWWYFEPGRAFGITPERHLRRRGGGADIEPGDLRLSWHLDGNGGYRAGCAECLNSDHQWRKLIFYRPASPLAEGLRLLLRDLQEEETSSLGTCVELISGDTTVRLHVCILLCRAPKLYQQICGESSLELAGTSRSALEDFALFLYSGLCPWDSNAETAQFMHGDTLRERVHALARLAVQLEVTPLAQACNAWLAMQASAPSDGDSAQPLGTQGSYTWADVCTGVILGRGVVGAVLEDDIHQLLGPGGIFLTCQSPDCEIVLCRPGSETSASVVDVGRSADAEEMQGPARLQAHRVVLAARSAFFRLAFAHRMQEDRSSTVHLGLVEDLGMWAPGQSNQPVALAFGALLRFMYSGRTDHVRPEHAVDLLTLLHDDFLQIPDSEVLCTACCTVLSGELSMEEAACVLSRAHLLGHADVKICALASLTSHLATDAAQGSIRQLTTSLPRELLVDLVEALALRAQRTDFRTGTMPASATQRRRE